MDPRDPDQRRESDDVDEWDPSRRRHEGGGDYGGQTPYGVGHASGQGPYGNDDQRSTPDEFAPGGSSESGTSSDALSNKKR